MPFRSSAGILEGLPDISRGDLSLYFLSDTGEVVRRIGPDDGMLIDGTPGPGRRAFETAVGHSGDRVVVTYDAALEGVFDPGHRSALTSLESC